MTMLAALASLALAAPASARRPIVYQVPGGGRLLVPHGSITDGAKIIIRRANGPRVPKEQIALGRPVKLRVAHGRLVGPVTLVLPYRGRIKTYGMPANQTVRLSYFDDKTKMWRRVPARVNRHRHTISARIRHFSWWNPLAWDWGSIFLRLDQRVGELRGARTAPAQCTSSEAVPAWVVQAITNNGADLQLRTCAEGQGDKIVVQIVNNRPYGMVLHYGAPVAWGWHQAPDDAGSTIASTVMDQLVTSDELYLPPLKAASVGIPEGSWFFASFQAGPNELTTFADLMSFIADQTDTSWIRKEALGALVADCSQQIKPTVAGKPTPASDPTGWVKSVSACVLGVLPKLAKAGVLDSTHLDQLQHVTSVLAGLGRGAEVGALVGRVADTIIGWRKDMQGNALFSVRRTADAASTRAPSPPATTPPGPTTPAPNSGAGCSGAGGTAAGGPGRVGFHIQDIFYGGTWARTDPCDGIWHSSGDRPGNAVYWYPNGLGVGVDCARTGAAYTVHFADGHTETWSTWFHVTDGKWFPSAAAQETTNNSLYGLPAC